MTTRQFLGRRRLWAIAIALVSLPITAFIEATWPWRIHLGSTLWLLIIGGLAFWIYRTPCLACHDELGPLAVTWAIRPYAIARRSPHCPHCDVSIDHDVSP